jgi:hypothetical protein
MQGSFKLRWLDSGHEPRCPPNPDYPDGVDIDASFDARHTCETPLPYPAQRCGTYLVECAICGVRVACTTAGRPDDPRSIKIACKELHHG